MSISYKLVQELKDAGFPMKEFGGCGKVVFAEEPYEDSQGNLITKGSALRVPTLSELVEACGDKTHFILMKTNTVWQAGCGVSIIEGTQGGDAPTPEEAVAKLYIALYNKGHEGKNNKNLDTNIPNDSLVSGSLQNGKMREVSEDRENTTSEEARQRT